jgi:hypothetical protein
VVGGCILPQPAKALQLRASVRRVTVYLSGVHPSGDVLESASKYKW